MNMINKDKRKKAWIGAVISGAISLGTAIYNNIQQNKATEEQQNLKQQQIDEENKRIEEYYAKQKEYIQEQQAAQTHKENLQNAMNLTNAYANNSVIADEYRKKLTLKNGGTVKYKDRFKFDDKYNQNKRKRAEGGTSVDWNGILEALLPNVGTLLGNAVVSDTTQTNAYQTANTYRPINEYIKTNLPNQYKGKDSLEKKSYDVNKATINQNTNKLNINNNTENTNKLGNINLLNNGLQDPLRLKFGGRKSSKCK